MRRFWVALAVAGCVAVAGVLAPSAAVNQATALVATACVPVAVLLTTRLNPPLRAAHSWFLFAATLAWTTGLLLEQAAGRPGAPLWLTDVQAAAGHPVPAEDVFPLGRLVFVVGHPLVAVAVALMARRRNPVRDLAGRIDVALLTAAVGLLAWVGLVEPAVTSGGSLPSRLLAAAYPLGDLLLVGVVATMMLQPARENHSFRLVMVAAVAGLAGESLHNVGHPSLWLAGEVLLTLHSVLLAFAILHPQAVDLTRLQVRPESSFTWTRFVALAAALWAAPVALAITVLSDQPGSLGAIILGSLVIAGLVVARLRVMVVTLNSQARSLRMLARTDHLTGIANRRTADSELARAMARARDGGPGVSVALLDLDHFKRYNDRFGHQAGDDLLVAFTVLCRGQLRTDEFFARFGGEEFLLLSSRSPAELARLIDHIRERMTTAETFSAGVAGWNRMEPLSDLLNRADQALYAAKDGGRGRTVVSSAGTARNRAAVRSAAADRQRAAAP